MLPRFNFAKLKESLTKTRETFYKKVSETITRKAHIDANTIDELEEVLISCDLGYDLVEKIIGQARSKILTVGDRSFESIVRIIKDELRNMLNFDDNDLLLKIQNSPKPFVIIFVGVNGSGKTTTLGKLAHNFQEYGFSTVIGSADTFRAAANDQLKVWAKRSNVAVIEKDSGDPASVAFDTVKKAIDEKIDIVLIDTAGRLHNNKNLMNEINKIQKVVAGQVEDQSLETLLVIDGNSGQNALRQAQEFGTYIKLTGLIITKLDGSAKGGVIFQICNDRKLPIRFLGVGEGVDDLQIFDAQKFLEAMIP